MPLRFVQEVATVTPVDIGEAIERRLDGRRHRDLIDATGIGESRISRIINGLVDVRVSELLLIEAAFGMRPGELLEEASAHRKPAPLKLAARKGKRRQR